MFIFDLLLLGAFAAIAFLFAQFVRAWIALACIIVMPLIALIHESWHVNAYPFVTMALVVVGVYYGDRRRRHAEDQKRAAFESHLAEDRMNEAFYDLRDHNGGAR